MIFFLMQMPSEEELVELGRDCAQLLINSLWQVWYMIWYMVWHMVDLHGVAHGWVWYGMVPKVKIHTSVSIFNLNIFIGYGVCSPSTYN